MVFDTAITTTDHGTLVGPPRAPHQIPPDRVYDGHASVRNDADRLGHPGAPIEGPYTRARGSNRRRLPSSAILDVGRTPHVSG